MTKDPIPKALGELPEIPDYFQGNVDNLLAEDLQFAADRYERLNEEEKKSECERVAADIRGKFARNGLTADKIGRIVEGIRSGQEYSQLNLDEQAGVDPDEVDEKYDTVRGYDSKPSEILESTIDVNDIACAQQFEELPQDVQWMYLLGIRTIAMKRHLTTKSYEDLSVYGRLPGDVVRQEAELYTAIADAHTDGLIQSEAFAESRRSSRFVPDSGQFSGDMLPSDLRNAGTSNYSINEGIFNAMPEIAADYLQAASLQLRDAQSSLE